MSPRTAIAKPAGELLDIETAAGILRATKNVETIKDVRDKGNAQALWLRYIKASRAAQNDAAEIVIKAERRLGEVLLDAPKAPAGRPSKIGSTSNPISAPPTLADLGIDKPLADRARKLARVPEPVLEAHIASVCSRAEKLTTKGAIAAASHVDGYDSDEWYTPDEYIDAAREVMGSIDLDPASNPRAQKVVKAKRWWSKADDGLARPWAGRIWLNPPYSQPLVQQFVDHLLAQWCAGSIKAAIVLLNASTDTIWWHSLAAECSVVCFTRGRIAFVGADGKPAQGNRVGQVFFLLSSDGECASRFSGVFRQLGTVLRGGGHG